MVTLEAALLRLPPGAAFSGLTAGEFAGRPDRYYEEQRLGIEFDGGVHRDQLVNYDRRQNRLLNAGVRLVRFTASDVVGQPAFVVPRSPPSWVFPEKPCVWGGFGGSFPEKRW